MTAQDSACPPGAVECVRNVSVTPGPAGERNDLTIRPDGSATVVGDTAAPLEAGPGCTKREDGTVRCEMSGPATQVQVETGDGDDVVRAALPEANLVTVILREGDDRFEGEANEVWANGLGGDDTLVALAGVARFEGRAGADVLVGGPASDKVLNGGPGPDRVSGGAGDDALTGADGDLDGFDEDERPAADELDGGPGRDLVTYATRTFAVAVDLADPAPDGASGEDDVLRSVEDVRGGSGGDRLAGDDGPNRLFGDQGSDVLLGRGGDDLLDLLVGAIGGPAERADGGDGDDVLRGYRGAFSGGDGDDVLRGGGRTASSCGAGFDTVRPKKRATQAMHAECERWGLRIRRIPGRPSVKAYFPRPRLLGGAVRIRVPCPRVLYARPCTVAVRATTPTGRLLARDRDRVLSGARETFRVRVTPAAARSPVRIHVRIRPDVGRTVTGAVVTRVLG